jgi:hypothetical protein
MIWVIGTNQESTAKILGDQRHGRMVVLKGALHALADKTGAAWNERAPGGATELLANFDARILSIQLKSKTGNYGAHK